MSRLSLIEEIITGIKECVGCNRTEGLEYCDNTMCDKCWSNENEVVPDETYD